MSNFVFNIAKGSAGHLVSLPGADDSLIVVPLEATGLESDATLIDYDSLGAILAASNNEQTTMGRKTASSVTKTVDDAANAVTGDMADVLWSGATGNQVGKMLVCYKPTSASADSDIIPLTAHDFTVSPNGGDISALVATSGFYRAS